MGMKLAQVSLSYGVDDIDGTVIEEKIYHMAGAQTPQQMAGEELVKAIREAGREPVQRDSLYRPVAVAAVDNRALAEGPRLAGAATTFVGASNEGGVA